VEDPTKPITWEQLSQILTFGDGDTKNNISPMNATQIGTVLACVRIISQAIAKMPFVTYSRTETGRERATSHPVFPLLRMRPDPASSAFTFIQGFVANLLLWGNGYAEITRLRNGMPVGLTLIESRRVKPEMVNGQMVYHVSGAGTAPETLNAYEILHVPGMTRNGLVGESVITASRRTLGIAKNAGDMAGTLAANGLRPGGVLETPVKLNEPGPSNLRKSFADLYSGPQNAGKVIVLEQGVTFKPWTMPAQDAELLASRQFSRKEIAEIFGVPLSLLSDNESAGSNVEATGLNFLNYTLDPLLVSIEQECNYKLFTPVEWDEVYCEFLSQAVLKMDSVARMNFYKGLNGIGAMSADEIRQRENMNLVPDSRGSVFYVPSNMMPSPTPEKADKILDGWIAKNSRASGKGEPAPETDSKVAG
jgi:HK97 family phage portal protein